MVEKRDEGLSYSLSFKDMTVFVTSTSVTYRSDWVVVGLSFVFSFVACGVSLSQELKFTINMFLKMVSLFYNHLLLICDV